VDLKIPSESRLLPGWHSHIFYDNLVSLLNRRRTPIQYSKTLGFLRVPMFCVQCLKSGKRGEGGKGGFPHEGKATATNCRCVPEAYPVITGFCDLCFTVDEVLYIRWNFAT